MTVKTQCRINENRKSMFGSHHSDFGFGMSDNKQDTGTVLDCFSIKHLSITKVKMGMQPWKNPGDISFTR